MVRVVSFMGMFQVMDVMLMSQNRNFVQCLIEVMFMVHISIVHMEVDLSLQLADLFP